MLHEFEETAFADFKGWLTWRGAFGGSNENHLHVLIAAALSSTNGAKCLLSFVGLCQVQSLLQYMKQPVIDSSVQGLYCVHVFHPGSV